MKAKEIEQLNLRKGQRVRIATPTGIIEGLLIGVEAGSLSIQEQHGLTVVKFGQVQQIGVYA